MSGALLQLVAIGAQDAMLYSSPEISFFRSVYRRHSPFSMEAILQSFQSSTTNFGSRLVATIARNGDLLSKLWLEISVPTNPAVNHVWVGNLGHAIIDTVEVEIGGTKIDRTYGRFMHLWHALTCRAEKYDGYNTMVGIEGSNPGAHLDMTGDIKAGNASRTLFIPIDFWFTRSPGQALPLVALQYHETRINITLAPLADLLVLKNTTDLKVFDTTASEIQSSSFTLSVAAGVGAAISTASASGGLVSVASGVGFSLSGLTTTLNFDRGYVQSSTSTSTVANSPIIKDLLPNFGYKPATSSTVTMSAEPKLWATYVFLESAERRRFSLSSHTYLIEQVQFTGAEVIQMTSGNPAEQVIRCAFNHPSKAIFITSEPSRASGRAFGNTFYNGQVCPDRFVLDLNGMYRPPVDNTPFKLINLQLNGHDRSTPRSGAYHHYVQSAMHFPRIPTALSPGLCPFSFGLAPSEHQISGALNFSRIDSTQLRLSFRPSSEFGESYSRTTYVYAYSLNSVSISSGLLGLTFSS